MKCGKCNNEMSECDVEYGECIFCINQEAYEQHMKELFKHDILIESLKEAGIKPQYEYDEGEYTTSGDWYLENKEGDYIENFYPEDLLKLYEIIIKNVQKKG